MLRGYQSCLFASVIFFAVILPFVTGCGENKSRDITASNSQYAPDTGGDSGEAASDPSDVAPEKNSAADRQPAEAPAKAAVGAGAANGQSKLDAFPPRGVSQEQAASAAKPPEGGPTEMLSHIDQLYSAMIQMLQNAGQDENAIETIRPQLERNLDAQVAAADKVLSLKPTDEQRVEAIYAKGRALHARLQIQAPNAEKDLRSMLQELADDEDSDVKRLTAVYQLEIPLVKLQTGQIEESLPVIEGLEEFLKRAELKDGSSLRQADKAIQTFLMLGREEDAVNAMKIIRTRIEQSGNLPLTVDAMTLTGNYLEQLGRVEEAKEVYNAIEQRAGKLEDPEAQEQVALLLENAKKRLNLIGQELKVENMIDLEGEPIDWSKYQGKVVLLDFWATWCGPCIREFPNIARVLQEYKEQGFEVIGVNVDDEMAPVVEFFGEQRLPWTIAFPDDPQKRGFANPLAQEAGVETLPFLLLLDQEGKVAGLHTRGPRLEREVRRLLNLPEEDQPGEQAAPAAEENPAAEKTPDASPAEQPESAEQPERKNAPRSEAETEPELDLPLQPAGEDKPEAEAPGSSDSSAASSGETFLVAFLADKDTQAEDGEMQNAEAPARNPYLADADLSTFELIQYLQDMEDKPRVIQQRPGFAEAVAEAADRVLAAPDAKEKYQIVAALVKIQFLHDRASYGDVKADAALAAFVEKMKDDPREKIAAEVKLLQLERRALEAEKLEPAENEKLLAELKTYFEEHKQELGEKHLRIASACIGAINKIEDGDTREELFGEFGRLFASSSNRELARYGSRLAKAPPVSDLVGKTLELEGLTELGTPFDWAAYRGKVVVVDFWATWCPPCRKAIPGLKELYQTHRDAGLDVIGVNLDEDPEALAAFLDQQELPWSNLVGEDATRLADKYGVGGLPTFVLVDQEGKVVDVSHSFETFQPKIQELLKAS